MTILLLTFYEFTLISGKYWSFVLPCKLDEVAKYVEAT